jgi:hypothetical protein
MNSTASSDWWRGEINWDTPAGRVLKKFFASLPTDRRFRLTLYGSAPLQLTLDPHWLSADVDLFSNDDEDLADWVARAGLSQEAGQVYLEPGFELSFRTSPRWRDRARVFPLGHVLLTLPHPLDILIGKLDRLEAKDLLAFRRVIELTGHPTETELRDELQNAVDLFRPSFDAESPNRYPENTRQLWRELFGREIDLRRGIIEPALARRAIGYGAPPPGYRRTLGE